jgi:uncharacterized protein YndB with AHSA1/START domain
MSSAPAKASKTEALELHLEREFNHPPEAVFKAWTDQQALRRWMGPGDVRAPSATMVARVGGAYVFPMQRPDGTVLTVRGVIQELVPNRKLRFTWSWDQDDGSEGQEMHVALEFHPTGTGTRLVLHQSNFPSEESRDHHSKGWDGCNDSLALYLGGQSST